MTYIQDPNAVLDYQWDWQHWVPQGDDIDTYQVIASPGLTIVSHSINHHVVTAFLSIDAGVPTGATLTATCRVTTANVPARVDDRSIEIVVGPR